MEQSLSFDSAIFCLHQLYAQTHTPSLLLLVLQPINYKLSSIDALKLPLLFGFPRPNMHSLEPHHLSIMADKNRTHLVSVSAKNFQTSHSMLP